MARAMMRMRGSIGLAAAPPLSFAAIASGRGASVSG
jgi:hypothetical protein